MGWKEKAAERVKEKSAGATIKIEEGTNCLRVMPDKKDILPDGRINPKGLQHPPYREFRIHRNVGPDKEDFTTLACGIDISGNGKCWLCNVKIPELEASGVPSKLEQADKIGVQEQFVVNASKVDSDTNKFTLPKPWWVSTGSGKPGKQGTSLAVRVYSKLASSKRDYVDPLKGYNLNVERTGTGMKTRYPSVESDEAPSKVPANILAAVKDLDTIIPIYDEEEQKSLYYGKSKRDDDDKPRRRAAAPARREEPEEEPVYDYTAEEGVVDVEFEEVPEGEDAPDETAEEYAEEEFEEPAAEEEVEEEPPTEDEPADEELPEEEFEPEPEPEEAPPPRRAAPAKQAPPARKAAPPTKQAPPTRQAPPPAKRPAAPVKKTAPPPARQK